MELYDAVVSRVRTLFRKLALASVEVFLRYRRPARRDVHWFNTVKISRSAVESSLGPSKLDQRARQLFILGASLSALFDLGQAPDFLKALLKLLEEWEMWTEGHAGGKGVASLRHAFWPLNGVR